MQIADLFTGDQIQQKVERLATQRKTIAGNLIKRINIDNDLEISLNETLDELTLLSDRVHAMVKEIKKEHGNLKRRLQNLHKSRIEYRQQLDELHGKIDALKEQIKQQWASTDNRQMIAEIKAKGDATTATTLDSVDDVIGEYTQQFNGITSKINSIIREIKSLSGKMVTKTYEPFGEFTITDPEAIKTTDQLTSELASQQQLYIDSITDWGGFISQVASWSTFKQLFSEMDQYRKSYIEANHNWSLCVHEQSANYQYLLLNPIATDERVVDDYKKLAAVCAEFDKLNDRVVEFIHERLQQCLIELFSEDGKHQLVDNLLKQTEDAAAVKDSMMTFLNQVVQLIQTISQQEIKTWMLEWVMKSPANQTAKYVAFSRHITSLIESQIPSHGTNDEYRDELLEVVRQSIRNTIAIDKSEFNLTD